jgi:ATP synthase protein I
MDDSFKEKLDALDQKLKAVEARKAKDAENQGAAAKMNNMGLAYRMVIDLIAGVVFGLFVGLSIDRVFGTAPWGLIIMILLGLAAGVRIMMQSAKKFEAERIKEENEDKNG